MSSKRARGVEYPSEFLDEIDGALNGLVEPAGIVEYPIGTSVVLVTPFHTVVLSENNLGVSTHEKPTDVMPLDTGLTVVRTDLPLLSSYSTMIGVCPSMGPVVVCDGNNGCRMHKIETGLLIPDALRISFAFSDACLIVFQPITPETSLLFACRLDGSFPSVAEVKISAPRYVKMFDGAPTAVLASEKGLGYIDCSTLETKPLAVQADLSFVSAAVGCPELAKRGPVEYFLLEGDESGTTYCEEYEIPIVPSEYQFHHIEFAKDTEGLNTVIVGVSTTSVVYYNIARNLIISVPIDGGQCVACYNHTILIATPGMTMISVAPTGANMSELFLDMKKPESEKVGDLIVEKRTALVPESDETGEITNRGAPSGTMIAVSEDGTVRVHTFENAVWLFKRQALDAKESEALRLLFEHFTV